MDENQPNKPEVDAELEKARKSMGNRIDADEEEATPEVKEPEKKPDEKKADEEEPKPEDKPKTEDGEEDEAPITKTDEEPPLERKPRPERYIPLDKYQDEKKQWKADAAEKEKLAARVKELEILAEKPEGKATNTKIAEFAEKHGMDADLVNDLVALAKADALPAETLEKIERANKIAAETEEVAFFETEFQKEAVPAIKAKYPNATDAQLKAAKDFLDKVSHTKDFFDKELGYVVYKNEADIAAIFTTEEPKKGKQGVDSGRMGSGKTSSLTAADFETTTDFAPLQELDEADQKAIIKGMSIKAYENFLQWAKAQDNGVEVVRNGRKVTLK